MKYKIVFTSQFTKAIKKIKKRRKDIAKLEKIVDTLSIGENLVYGINTNDLILLLIETGTHSDLF